MSSEPRQNLLYRDCLLCRDHLSQAAIRIMCFLIGAQNWPVLLSSRTEVAFCVPAGLNVATVRLESSVVPSCMEMPWPSVSRMVLGSWWVCAAEVHPVITVLALLCQHKFLSRSRSSDENWKYYLYYYWCLKIEKGGFMITSKYKHDGSHQFVSLNVIRHCNYMC